MRLTVGDILLNEVINDKYFNNLYIKLLLDYGKFIFDFETSNWDENDVLNLLRFADLLSKSNNKGNIYTHKNLSQDIIIMLSVLLKNSKYYEIITLYEKSIFLSVSNYVGYLKIYNENAISKKVDFMSNYADNILMEENRRDDKYLFDEQIMILKKLENNQYYSFSAPTSMGKTFVIKKFIIEELKNNYNIIFVLPTKALINEMEMEFSDDFGELLVEHNYVLITSLSQLNVFKDKHYILILTPERTIQLFHEYSLDLKYIIIDEAQKILENDSRSPLYYKIFSVINAHYRMSRIIFSSPYAKNPEELLKLINNQFKNSSVSLYSYDYFDFSPVMQRQFIIDSQTQNIKILNKLSNKFINIGIKSIDWKNLVLTQSKQGSSIVYCKSKNDAVLFANELSDFIHEKNILDANVVIDSEIQSLIKLINSEISPDYYLIDLLKKGIAYHIGMMPSEIRIRIEKLVKNGKIKYVFCTSTLLEGVNLPAVNIFVLSHKKGRSSFSYLDFKNLIGRAGRIKFNVFGNAFLLNFIDNRSNDIYTKLLEKENENNILKPEASGRIISLVSSLYSDDEIMKKGNESYESLKKFVMYRNILGEAIISNDTENIIYKHYEKDIKKNDISQLKFTQKDVNFDFECSFEIINRLRVNISNNVVQLPTISEDEKNSRSLVYKKVLEFLQTLYEYFKWETFEPNDGVGSLRSLSHYANLSTQWIFEDRLSKIIALRNSNYQKKGNFYDKTNHRTIDYQDSKYIKNMIINEVMTELDQDLKYTIVNYSEKFVRIFCETTNSVIDFSIADYLIYGTMNKIVIVLQRIGLSREFAKYIFDNKLYYLEEGKLRLIDFATIVLPEDFIEEYNLLSLNLRQFVSASII